MTEEVDTQALMREIRQRVRASLTPAPPPEAPDEELQSLLEQLDIDVPREISTHRKLLGPLYVRFRRWVYRETRLTLEPVLGRQNQLNRRLARLAVRQQEQIDTLTRRVEELEARLKETR